MDENENEQQIPESTTCEGLEEPLAPDSKMEQPQALQAGELGNLRTISPPEESRKARRKVKPKQLKRVFFYQKVILPKRVQQFAERRRLENRNFGQRQTSPMSDMMALRHPAPNLITMPMSSHLHPSISGLQQGQPIPGYFVNPYFNVCVPTVLQVPTVFPQQLPVPTTSPETLINLLQQVDITNNFYGQFPTLGHGMHNIP